MKISIDVDLTPEEMRRLVGLPDVQTFNDKLMAKLQERMEAGVEGYDPQSLMRPFMKHVTGKIIQPAIKRLAFLICSTV